MSEYTFAGVVRRASNVLQFYCCLLHSKGNEVRIFIELESTSAPVNRGSMWVNDNAGQASSLRRGDQDQSARASSFRKGQQQGTEMRGVEDCIGSFYWG
jgi:hypothetical protein